MDRNSPDATIGATERDPAPGVDFIRATIADDVRAGRNEGRVVTRFPPEPNGYLHIGHAKSICLNFGVAGEFGGTCNLRFDDTNPTKEDVEYASPSRTTSAGSASMDRRTALRVRLLRAALRMGGAPDRSHGQAYVDSLTADEIRQLRGTLTEPGADSPYRNRSARGEPRSVRAHARGRVRGRRPRAAREDRHGVAEPQHCAIRCCTGSAARTHHRTGDAWCIYPMYDYAHPLSDALERITHSLCTLEFEDHRPLYDWLHRERCRSPATPQQIEFARLNLTYTVMSKRKLLQLVQESRVNGWDDPRMPTISGLRRRGYTPDAIRAVLRSPSASQSGEPHRRRRCSSTSSART